MLQAVPQDLTPAQGHAVLYQRIYAPAFFSKLAGFNINPKTQEEADTYLRCAASLRDRYDAAKQAEANVGDPVLNKMASELGADTSPTVYECDQDKQAAFKLAGDADLARAVLALMSAPQA